MALKEAFVDGDVFDSDDALHAFHLFDGVHQQKGIAVRQDFLDPVVSRIMFASLRFGFRIDMRRAG